MEIDGAPRWLSSLLRRCRVRKSLGVRVETLRDYEAMRLVRAEAQDDARMRASLESRAEAALAESEGY